tara:strand:+ start:107 stop:934 length:828 start_codon:yes stop_codon:yes gene_type:complete
MSDTFLAVGAPCGGSHYMNYILNQMGVDCTLERPIPGKSLVQWHYATGYDVFDHHGGETGQQLKAKIGDVAFKPNDALYDDNYNAARETYPHIIHYTRNPFHSIPCLAHELGATSFETYLRKTVIRSVREKKPNFWQTSWHLVGETECNVAEYVLDFWYKWHKLILSKKPDITIQIEKVDNEIYDFLKDKMTMKQTVSGVDITNKTGSRKSLPGRKSQEEETQIFIDDILPSINILLLKEVVKLGHQFGYTFPEEVAIRCKSSPLTMPCRGEMIS